MKRIFLLMLVLIMSVSMFMSCSVEDEDEKKETYSDTDNTEDSVKSDKDSTEAPVEEENEAVQTKSLSWDNMKIDNEDLKLTEDQKKILEYYDDDYFPVYEYDTLQRYPKLYNKTQVSFWGGVMKMLETNDKSYTCLVHFHSDTTDENSMIGVSDDTNYIVVKGRHPVDGRVIEGDLLQFYGRYMGVDQYTVDGTSSYYPTVIGHRTASASFTGFPAERFTLSDIKDIARIVFGNNFKIDDPTLKSDYMLDPYHPNGFLYYLVTLDDQSNANFSEFEFCRNYGLIRDSDISSSSEKRFYISHDFEHYIITVFNKDVNTLYLDYYDRDFNKLWGREFENTDTAVMDYTADAIYIAADNDLYVIDSDTGEDVMTPVYVGEKVKINVVEDGIYLIGSGNKDNVMKLDREGNIIWKTSVDYEIGICEFLQIVDSSLIIHVGQADEYGWYSSMKMYSFDSDGNMTTEFTAY